MSEKIQIITNLSVYPTADELDEVFHSLHLGAKTALKNAYAPYSEFKVGAALLLENGEIVLGNNQENAAYPSGLCAERVAFFAAGANFHGVRIVAAAIVAGSEKYDVTEPVSPCGACRQVMAEYETKQKHSIPVIFSGETGPVFKVDAVGDLLPLKFNGSFLKKG
jgi:cytidine deaminase